MHRLGLQVVAAATALILAPAAVAQQAGAEADRIDGAALPGWKCLSKPHAIAKARGEPCLPSRHYSGYLDISAAADGSKMVTLRPSASLAPSYSLHSSTVY